MTDKFENIPVEDDTKILLSTTTKFGDYDALYQKWFWDNITAESLIFSNPDIEKITLDKLENDIRYSPLVNDSSKEITTSKINEYTFVNFNFVIDDD